METQPNPAFGSKHAKSKSRPPSTTRRWNGNELPEFFERLEKNEPMGRWSFVSAVKVTADDLPAGGFSGRTEWEELDYKKNLWTIPASRMKNKKNTLFRLTDPLKDVLEQFRE